MAMDSVAHRLALQSESASKGGFCDCGARLETTRKTQKRCKSCSVVFCNRRKRERRLEAKEKFHGPPKPRGSRLHKLPALAICVVCGNRFEPKSVKACYCSDACSLVRFYQTRREAYARERNYVDGRKNPKHKDRICHSCNMQYKPTSSKQKCCKACRDSRKLKTVKCEDCDVVFKQNCGRHKLCTSCKQIRKNKHDNAVYHAKRKMLDESQKGFKERECVSCGVTFKPIGSVATRCRGCAAARKARLRKARESRMRDEYRRVSKEWIEKNKSRLSQERRIRYESDINYRVAAVCRTVMKAAFRSQKKVKQERFKDVLGISIEGFVDYLLSHPRARGCGFTAENYGTAWHIDHIRPIASFDLSDPKQVREAFHYTNCQPMDPIENVKKNSYWKGARWVKGVPQKRFFCTVDA